MEQGLRLLIQLVIEFAPVIASLIQKQTEDSLNTTTYPVPQVIIEGIQSVNSLVSQQISALSAESEKRQQQKFLVYQYETQLKIAQQQRETALQLPEVHKIAENWPLRLSPSQILESHKTNGRTPLKIFLAPPAVKFDKFDSHNEEIPEFELMLAEGLRQFINQHYSLHCPFRPTEFLAGAWDSKRFHSESSIKALFGTLKTEPILILESENEGNSLNFRIAYWGLGQGNYFYKTISRLPYKQILEESAKSRALAWKKIRDELLALGESLEEINNLGKDNVRNLAILQKEEQWRNQGIDISNLGLRYQINNQDYEKLCQVLITCHCLVAGWVADVYHLVHHNLPALLPKLLPSLLEDVLDFQSVEAIVTGYKQVYQALEANRRYWIPELALQLAQSLSHLPNRSWAEEQVKYSITTWLELRQVSLQEITNPLEAMQSALKIEDEEYVSNLREYFGKIGDRDSILMIERLLEAIANLKYKRTLESATLTYTLTGHSGKVSAVAISPDGEIVVSGCADKTVKIWNVKTGTLIRNLSENLGEISSIAVSPDGDFLAVGSCEHPKSNIKVWHLKTGKLLHTLLGHQKPVNLVVISPDGQILASGSHKIKIWNLHTGERICTLWHISAVYSAAISPDGTILASGSADTKIRLWNPRTGEPLRTLVGHGGEVKSIVMSPDGEIFLSGSADKTIKIWHLSTGKLLHTLTGHLDEVNSLALSADGQILYSGSADKTIKMWDLNTGKVLQTLTRHDGAVNSVALSGDGSFLVSGSSDETINIWQINQSDLI